MRDAGSRTLLILLATTLALLLFRSTEQIDVFVTDLFFQQRDCSVAAEGARCGNFPMGVDPFWMWVRFIGHESPIWLMAGVCLHMTWLMMFNPNKTMADLYPPIVAIITAVLGPLLLVNVVLKEYWGRPRPIQTLFFGGENPYVAPGDISSFCETNCSFVSGEASAAFWLVALMFYFTGKSRIRYLIVAVVIASGIAFLRVTFGRHYISDVVVGGLTTVFFMGFAVWLLQTEFIRYLLAMMLKFSNTYAFGRRKIKN